MKKKFIILVSLFMFFVGTNSVSAMTLKPTGVSSGKIDDEIIVYITLGRDTTEKTVSAVEGEFRYDSNNLELVSSTTLIDNWTEFASITSGSVFGYGNIMFDNLITTTNQNIVKVVFKIKNATSTGITTVSVVNPSATDEDGNLIEISGGAHDIKVLSDINKLSNLIFSNGTINFNENTTEYNLTIDSDSTTISATKKDDKSTISGDVGKKTLNYGINTFKITVTSESGQSKTYTINVTRPDNRSKVNTLSSLKLSNGTINFNENTTEYNLIIDSDSTTISATKKDDKSTIAGDVGKKTLNYGINTFKITVTSESGQSKTYTINVTRPDKINSINNILKLNFIGYDIDFNKDVVLYNIDIENNVNKFAGCSTMIENTLCLDKNIVVTENSKLELFFNDFAFKLVDNFNFSVSEGKNVLKIKVIDESKNEKIYAFNINRKSKVIDNNINDDKDVIINPGTGNKLFIVIIGGILGMTLLVGFRCFRNKTI